MLVSITPAIRSHHREWCPVSVASAMPSMHSAPSPSDVVTHVSTCFDATGKMLASASSTPTISITCHPQGKTP